MLDSDEDNPDLVDHLAQEEDEVQEPNDGQNEEAHVEDYLVQHEPISTGEEVTKPSVKTESRNMEELFALMQQGKSAKTTPIKFGCMRKMLQGRCDKVSCQYSHNEAAVMQTARDMKEKIDAYINSHSNSSGGKPQNPVVLRRDHFGDSRA